METRNLVDRLIYTTRHWPVIARYTATLVVVGAVVALRHWADPILGDQERFTLFFGAILLAATLFDRGSGIVATGLSALAVTYFYWPPPYSLIIENRTQLVSLLLFVGIGTVVACVVEAMHRAIEELQAAQRNLQEGQRLRVLLLEEFRHRTRNDLGSLAAILLLRARAATSDAAREGLREAADHAMALARVHTLLAQNSKAHDDATTVDTHEFVVGLCNELGKVLFADGLRPIALIAEAERHRLSTERSVQLGLVLNEAITNAFKYAFPEGQGGKVYVHFVRNGAHFVLNVTDDGPGILSACTLKETPPAPLPNGSGFGTRLLRGLAAQLGGSYTRRPGVNELGTIVELRFPVSGPREVPVA